MLGISQCNQMVFNDILSAGLFKYRQQQQQQQLHIELKNCSARCVDIPLDDQLKRIRCVSA